MRNRHILAIELLLIAAAAYGAFALRFEWRFYDDRAEFLPFLAMALVVKPIVFYLFGLYTRLWRHASVNDLSVIVLGVSASSLVMTLGILGGLVLSPTFQFSRAVILIDWLLTLVTAGGLRISVRVLREARRLRAPEAENAKRLLIVGAGDAGAMVIRECQRNPQLGMTPVALVDDDPRTHRHRVHGIPVVGATRALAAVAREKRVDEVVIAMPRASGDVIRAISERCRDAGIASRTVPGVYELLDGRVSVSRLRNVAIDDLLRRASVGGDGQINEYVQGRVVLVTGAGGSIGFELCRQVTAARPEMLVMLGHGENSLFDAVHQLRESLPHLTAYPVVADIRDRRRLAQVFEHFQPEIVFHAAAHKHVPLMESNPAEALTNNVIGTQNVVDAALAVEASRLVMISSDKAVAPSSVMGASKRAAELVVTNAARSAGVNYSVVRFGNVLGSRGSVVPTFKRQIERGGPITITHPEMRRFFMTIPEAVHLVLQAGGIGKSGELFVLEMGEPISIVALAQDLIRLSGFSLDEIRIEFTGLREGEKLTELLWHPGASVSKTTCAGVLRVVENQPDPESIDEMVASMARAADTGDRLSIEAELARWVPSYVPASGTASLADISASL